MITEAVDPPGPVDGLGQRLLHVQRTRTSSTSGGSSRRFTSAAALYQGHRSTRVVPALRDVDLAARAFAGRVYKERRTSVALRPLPAQGPRGRVTRVWTTTPWTLPANVAAAVNPDAEYVKPTTASGLRVDALSRGPCSSSEVRAAPGPRRARVRGAVRPSACGQQRVVHRVIPWDEVSLEEGPGIVHIAPGAGTEDFELSRVARAAGARRRSTRRAAFPRVRLASRAVRPVRRADQIVGDLRERGLLEHAGTYIHRYPTAGAARRRFVFRVVDDWFIACDEIRRQAARRERDRGMDAAFYGKRMDDWLRNMGDWNISRKRYFGLPLPIYPCGCGHLNVIGSRAELEERATAGLEQLRGAAPPVDRRRRRSRCESCGAEVRRVPEVGDVWLDAGIVPFSTLGWQNPEWIEGGYATGAAEGLSGADLPDHAYWEQWFPAHWVSEMREQIRLWFYSLSSCRSILDGRRAVRAVLGHEEVRDEHGQEMHGSWGNTIEAHEALDAHGRRRDALDVLRGGIRLRASSSATRPASEIKRRLLTLWNSVVLPARRTRISRAFAPHYQDLERGPQGIELRSLDRWLLARTQADARRARGRIRALLDARGRRRIRPLRRRCLQLVHPPLAPPLLLVRRGRVQNAVVRARAGGARYRAGDALPGGASLAEPRCRAVRGRATLGAPRRVADGGGKPRRRRAGRRGGGGAARRRARLPRALGLGAQAAAAVAATDRPGRAARRGARRRDRVRASRERHRARRGRGDRAHGQAEPARARSQAREGARRGARRAPGRRVRGASRRRLPGCRSRALGRRGAGRAARPRRAGRSPRATASRSPWTRLSTTSCAPRAACSI